ncbi:lipid II flippase MurJ [Haloarcula amylovorans]|uniref:lipid II flippase MurJ n=1 Tax=Haloarcula amylovorans TaxID=2562280 RepID=UPI0010766782|nr:polysaccharide biosynthesis C-terminal domain-containing protein [Halomicroarcula amylolytica]
MRLGKTTLVHFFGQVVVSVAGFAATFAIAVLGGSSTLGRYAIAVSLGSFLLIVPAQAIGSGVRKRMSEGHDPAAYLGVGAVVNGAVALALGIGVLLVGHLLRMFDPIDAEIIQILARYNVEIAALVVVTSAYRTVRSAIEGDKQVGESGLLQGGERVLRSLLQIGVLLVGYSVSALVVGHSLSVLVGSIAGVALISSSIEFPTRAEVRSVLDYARYAWLGTLRTRVYGWLDTFVLSFFVTASLVGIYEAAWGIATLLGIISTAIRRTLFPEVSELSQSDDFERIHRILEDGLVFSGVFVIPGLFGGAVIGQRVLRFYSPEFGQGAGILLVLICAYVADVYGSQFLNVLNGVDRPDLAYRINGVFIAVSIVLNVALVWRFGWYGAAVATACSSAVRTVMGYLALESTIKSVPLPIGEIGRELLAAAVMASLLLPVAPLIPAGRAGTLVLVVFGAAIYFVALLVLSRRVREKGVTVMPAWLTRTER